MLIPKVDLEGNVNSNLNTSHVNVNQKLLHILRNLQLYLNTSHVNVNPLILSHSYISIILFSSHSIKLL